MNPVNFEMHSGGAIGADSFWDEIGRKFGIRKIHHYYYMYKNPKSSDFDELTFEQYLEGVDKVNLANKTLNRKGLEKYMHLLARNWLQVKKSDCIYAIGELERNKVKGGTGWAIQMAIDHKKPIYVFDQNIGIWYTYNFKTNSFEKSSTPILTYQYAGIGTRQLNAKGEQAIRAVYIKTFHDTGLF